MTKTKAMTKTYYWFVIALFIATRADAAPSLERFFPAGVQAGTETTLAAEGKFPEWPVEAWCDAPGIELTPLEKNGALRISVSQDAECGIHWVRFVTDRGVSAAKPLVVSNVRELVEVADNDRPEKGQPLKLPCIVNGRLDKREDVDVYNLDLEAGETVVAHLGAHRRLGTPMDGVLQLLGPSGYVIEQNDDARGLDPLIVFKVAESGTYSLRTFGFPSTPNQSIRFAGGKEFVYRLAVTTGGFLDHTLPLAASSDRETQFELFGWNLDGAESLTLSPSSGSQTRLSHPNLLSSITLPVVAGVNEVERQPCGPSAPQSIVLGCRLSGRIEQPGDIDSFQFTGRKDQRVEARVDAAKLGSLLDPMLVLLDASGKVVAEVDDVNRQQQDCILRSKLPQDGDYSLQLRDAHQHGGLRYFYRLEVKQTNPDFELTVSTDHFEAKRGAEQSLTIEVSVDRQDGFDKPIEVEAAGLPESISFDKAVSETGGDTEKKVKLTLQLSADQEPFRSQFQLFGTTNDDSGRRRIAVFRVPLPEKMFDEFWLTLPPASD